MMKNNIQEEVQTTLVEKYHSKLPKTKPLRTVVEEIGQTIDIVDINSERVKKFAAPMIEGKPWYHFAFGKASTEEVNKALTSFTKFLKDTFGLIGVSQQFQNENTKDLCNLLGILAIAEAEAYSQLKELSTEDEKDAENLRRLENSFKKSLDEESEDRNTKEEQFKKLIEYITAFTKSKTKKIRSLNLRISELENSQSTWVNNCAKEFENTKTKLLSDVRNSQMDLEHSIKLLYDEKTTLLDRSIEEFRKSIETTIGEQNNRISEVFKNQNRLLNDYKSMIEENHTKTISSIHKLDEEIRVVSKSLSYLDTRLKDIEDFKQDEIESKTILDTRFCKIILSVVSVSALICSICSLLL